MALRHGLPKAPWWVPWLDMCEAWGRPPWEIVPGRGSPLIWVMRYQVYRKAKIDVERERTEKLNG